ncbi:MAG: hypothetical protein R6U50_00860 [Desulfobacterales bacterium]
MKHMNVGFSIHRPEMIPKTAELMGRHEAVFLEEPPLPEYESMLEGRISVEDYLLPQDLEYPEFSRQMCNLEKQLHAAGKQLIQVEPFYEVLLSIHEFFARGNTPNDLKPNHLSYYVYMAERQTTAALLHFYQTAAASSFNAVVEAVIRFAKADAQRFRLRDSLRAQAIVKRVDQYSSIYVEAGTIHYLLWRELYRMLSSDFHIKPVFLNRLVMKEGEPHSHLYSPGDRLTLFYIFHPRGVNQQKELLLAARSIIYSKIIQKQESFEKSDSFRHVADEIACIGMVKKLTLDDCRNLFARIRKSLTAEAREVVETYTDSGKDDD